MSESFEQIYQQWRRGVDLMAGLGKLFVVGSVKSGTTWIMNFLNGHPQIVVRGEGAFTYQLVPALQQALALFNQHQKAMDPIAQLRDIDLLLTSRCMIDSQLLRYVAESGRDFNTLRIVGDKTPQHSISMPLLAQLYPGAKFIHIIRDPRDVATSAWFHFGKSDPRSFEDFLRHYITQVWPVNVGGARQAAPAIGDRYYEVKYETLIEDETTEIRKMLKFLGADASDEAVQACVQAGDFKKRSGGRDRGQMDADSFYRSGTAGDWQNHLPVEIVADCCEVIAPLMIECGYDPTCAEVAA